MAYFRQGLRSAARPGSARAERSPNPARRLRLAVANWSVLPNGPVNRNGSPPGNGFCAFYAGSIVFAGRTGDVSDAAAHHAREQQIFGAARPVAAERATSVSKTARRFLRRRAVAKRRPARSSCSAGSASDLVRRVGTIFCRLQCGKAFRLIPRSGPCDASASASLFSRVAG